MQNFSIIRFMPVKRMFIVFFILYFIFGSNLFAQYEKIASFPFRGNGLSNDEKEHFADMFVTEFLSLKKYKYELVTRTSSQELIDAEMNYQRTGSTDGLVEIGRQSEAHLILVGHIRNISTGKLGITVQIINTKTSGILGSSYKENLYSLDDINKNLVKDMVEEINSQIYAKEITSDKAKQEIMIKEQNIELEQFNIKLKKINNGIKHSKNAENAGHAIWATGLAMSLTVFFVDWGLSNEPLYFERNPPIETTTTSNIYDAFGQIIGTTDTTTGIYDSQFKIRAIQDTFRTGVGLTAVGIIIASISHACRKGYENEKQNLTSFDFSFTPYLVSMNDSKSTIAYDFRFSYKF